MKKVYIIYRDIACDYDESLEIVLVTTDFQQAQEEFNTQVEDARNYAERNGFVIDAAGDDSFESHKNGYAAQDHYNVKIECHPLEGGN